MRRPFAFSIACLLVFAGIALAQNSPSAVGTWKMDASQSDFGSEPAPKAMTLTIFKDTPRMVSWRVRYVDAKGKVTTYSWSGPPDGSMHSVMQNGKAVSKQSAKKEANGVLLRHGEDSDGSSFDAVSTISEDGKTVTDDITMKSKDGKET